MTPGPCESERAHAVSVVSASASMSSTSTPKKSPMASGSASASASTATLAEASTSGETSSQGRPGSRWKSLFSAFRKSKREGRMGSGDQASGEGGAFRMKHSHNCSNAHLKAGVSNMKGYKKANQDRCTAFSYLDEDPDLAYFGVYDGHGGTGVANYLKDHLHRFILDQAEYKEGNMEEAILKAFLQVDQELRTYGQATELTGSTATIVMVKRGEIFVANLGDSRATGCVLGLAKPLTCDHNTANVKERERISAMGGVIKENRVGGVLIPTRSFGDFLLKSELDKPAWKQVISAVPQIQTFKLSNSWDFVVLATDGVWDAMSNQEMVSFIKPKLKTDIVLSSLCEEILDHCCSKTIERFGKNCCDNMTIIIIQFVHKKSTSQSQGQGQGHKGRLVRQRTCDRSSETGSSSVVSSAASR